MKQPAATPPPSPAANLKQMEVQTPSVESPARTKAAILSANRVKYRSFESEAGTAPASVHLSRFCGESGVEEMHLVVRPTRKVAFATQLDAVFNAYRRALVDLGIDMRTAVFRRFFCSDLVNQAAALDTRPFSNPRTVDPPCAVSWVQQPPASPGSVVLWAYHMHDPASSPDTRPEGSTLTLQRGSLSHRWTTGIACPATDSPYDQTKAVLSEYDACLRSCGLTLADHAIRTWIFVRDIDSDYAAMVAARREFFATRGLTPKTHFIASSGIEGAHANPSAKVALDAYAIGGLQPDQIEFLSAPDHLSPTYRYGVTFERGTSVAYRDRKHVILSGTASIDREGRIVYPGNMVRQLERTLENMSALLHSAGATIRDMGYFIVYVREAADAESARRLMLERYPETPTVIVTGPVCRPGWLIEVEGTAVIPASNPVLPPF